MKCKYRERVNLGNYTKEFDEHDWMISNAKSADRFVCMCQNCLIEYPREYGETIILRPINYEV